MTLEALDKANMTVKKETYEAARDGRQGVGRYLITGSADKDMGIQVVWQNSYDKSLTVKWAIGSEVFVCGNGMVRGDMGSFKRKHTGEAMADYKKHVGMYVTQAGELFDKMIKDRERMKEIEITKRTSAELVGRLFLEDAIITSTQLNIIKKEMEFPTFKYGKGTEGSAWQLYNHATVALKEAHPELYLKQHIELHNFFTKEFAL